VVGAGDATGVPPAKKRPTTQAPRRSMKRRAAPPRMKGSFERVGAAATVGATGAACGRGGGGGT
jgi:hypothetical protein